MGKSVFDDRLKKVIEIALKINKTCPSKRILDVGCGDGVFTQFLGETLHAEEIYGVDLSGKAVKIARSKRVNAVKIDVNEQDLPFQPEYFDLVFAGEVVEHLFDVDHFLTEVYRVLKLGGVFIITTPNLASLYNRVAMLLGYQPFRTYVSIRNDVGHLVKIDRVENGVLGSSDHIRLFTYRSLYELLTVFDFKVVKSLGVHSRIFQTNYRLLRIVDATLSRIPSLSSTIIVWSEKKAKSVTQK
jgi:2-polyprenyl-3-methyl-5-hydroxy-6-metoxy-1,4-benzoquinol methylase